MTAVNWFVLVGGSLGLFGYIPQIITMIKTRNTAGLSFWWLFLGEIAWAVWLWYGIHLSNPNMIVMNMLGTTLQGAVLILFIAYRISGK